MKKSTLILLILASFALALFPSCDDSSNATELRWTNNSDQNNIVEIQWVNWENGDEIDQTWNGDITVGTTTDFKKVSILNGQGLASDGTDTFQIRDANSEDNFILSEGDSQTIAIDSLL